MATPDQIRELATLRAFDNNTVSLDAGLLSCIQVYHEEATVVEDMMQRLFCIVSPSGHLYTCSGLLAPDRIYINQHQVAEGQSFGLFSHLPKQTACFEAPQFSLEGVNVKLIDHSLLSACIKQFVCSPMPFVSPTDVTFGKILGALCSVVVGLKEDLKYYLQYPDNGVEVIDGEQLMATDPVLASAIFATKNSEPIKTKIQSQFIGLMLLLFINKVPVNDNQIGAVRTKRLKAFCAYMSAQILSTDGLNLISNDTLNNIANMFSTFPKLKATIFSRVLVNSHNLNDKFAPHVTMLLEDSQITAFALIHKFVFTTRKTEAHIHPVIINQIREFLIVMKDLIKKFGEKNWRFVKLLDPTCNITSAKRWPELTSCALVHSRATDYTLINLISNVFSPFVNYGYLLNMSIRPEFFLHTFKLDDKTMADVFNDMNLDYEKIQKADIADVFIRENTEDVLQGIVHDLSTAKQTRARAQATVI